MLLLGKEDAGQAGEAAGETVRSAAEGAASQTERGKLGPCVAGLCARP